MFENVSEKLKFAAKAITVLGVLCGILLTVVSIINKAGFVNILICISIPLDFYIFSLCLYAFAGILKNTYLINQNAIEILKNLKKQDEQNGQNEQKSNNYMKSLQNVKAGGGSWICENCDNKNPAQTTVCMSCGKHR